MERYTAYDRFAAIYNRHWGDFAQRVLDPLQDLCLRHLPKKARVLDLCCGTGQLAHLLTERGFRVTGIDGSEEMLNYARENAPNAHFVAADARNFDLGTGYQAVVSTYDSLNHIMTLDELRQVFEHVYLSLIPGGVFVFDMNLEAGFTNNGMSSYGMVEDDHAYAVKTEYDSATQEGRFHVTMFFKGEKGAAWEQADLTLVQRAYPLSALETTLTEVGFADVSAHYPHGQSRVFLRCVRPLNS